MQREHKTKIDLPTYEPYIVGNTYDGKGLYLGKTKNVHKFLRHQSSFTFARVQNFGPKYCFVKA